jgi:uncharacterized membrane protein HdeD (DUF308 family)
MAAETEARGFDWGSWWIPVVVGLVSVVAGVLAIAWPGVTLLALALVAGINLVFLSVWLIFDAMSDAAADDRTLRIVVGVLGIIGGGVVIRRPGDTLLVLVVALGLWLIVAGTMEIFRAFTLHEERRWLHALGGLVDIGLGVAVLALPGLSLATLAVLVGIAFIARGVMLTVDGFRLRSLAHHPRPTPGTTPFSPTPA